MEDETPTNKTCIYNVRNYTLQLRQMLARYDSIMKNLKLDKHPSEREWIINEIDTKLKLAALHVHDDILGLLAQYIERDYLRMPFDPASSLEQLSTLSDEENSDDSSKHTNQMYRK